MTLPYKDNPIWKQVVTIVTGTLAIILFLLMIISKCMG